MASKSVLIVWGGWSGHTPHECADVFEPWLKSRGYRVTVSDNLDIYADKRRMRRFNLVIPIWTMGGISAEQWQGLRDALLNGTNIAGWHGGMCDSFRENTEYQFMTGGQWVAHPGGIVRYKVKITKPGDPIVKDISDFYVRSEQYYMHTDPGNDVLATTTFSGRHDNISWIKGTIMPVIWKRRYGKARVFYSSLGHTAEEFSHPPIFKIMKRGILWAIGDSPSAV
jgi:type 1 glutamine amidotransferase